MSPPLPPADETLVIITSVILTMMYSCCPSPAFLWTMVASGMCLPLAHALSRFGDALSTLCTKVRSWKLALPAPPPPPTAMVPACCTPHDQL